MNKKTYVPGVCNIGPDEIKRRIRGGWIGLVATIFLWKAFVWFGISPIWKLTLFFPAMMSATGFLQAYMHFCVYFGFSNMFNFNAVGKSDSVEQAEFRSKDRRKAWQILIYSIIIGAVIAFLGYML